MNTPAYHLQKYNGPSTRYTCPSCGAKHRFTRYVDAYGRSLHPSVGRCDRESACGYHKTPRDYFAEHPVEKKVTPVVVPEAKPKDPVRIIKILNFKENIYVRTFQICKHQTQEGKE